MSGLRLTFSEGKRVARTRNFPAAKAVPSLERNWIEAGLENLLRKRASGRTICHRAGGKVYGAVVPFCGRNFRGAGEAQRLAEIDRALGDRTLLRSRLDRGEKEAEM